MYLSISTTGCFKKTALIEKSVKDTNVNLDYTERAVFLISDHHCDMANKYLYLPGWFFGSSRVFSGHFMGVSRTLHYYFNSMFNVIQGCS